MGCGAMSSVEGVQRAELQFKKLVSIHKGEQSQIWTGQDRQKQKYSIKVFKKIFIDQDNRSMLANFQRQIQRLLKLRSPASGLGNQLGLNGFDPSQSLMPYTRAWKDENGNLSLIMRHIDGNSLGDEVKGKLPGYYTETMIAKMTQQILRTIAFLRSTGSMFCNFKPSNVFFSKQTQTITLTDYFNLSEYFNISRESITKNPIYSAPENVLFGQYFEQSDVWRVGCFVGEMLTCIRPWFKETTSGEQIVESLRRGARPPLPEKVSKAGRDFMEKCFEADHNRRISVEELLKHQWILQNSVKSARQPTSRVDNTHKLSRQNTSNQQIASYNLQIQLLEQSPPQRLNKKQPSNQKSLHSGRLNLEQLSNQKTVNTQNHTKTSQKKVILSSNSIKLNHGFEIERIINENDEIEKTVEMKKSRNHRSRRIKTDVNEYRSENTNTNVLKRSPFAKYHTQQDVLALMNKQKPISMAKDSNSPAKNLSISRKISKTSGYRISSKKKIGTNTITLNNQAISFQNNSPSNYWPGGQNPFDNFETAQKLSMIMKQIQQQGGKKYYKKPLKLLKQKLRDKSLRTETSITLEDSGMREIEEIDVGNNGEENGEESTENYNMTNVSQVSFKTNLENVVIETMASKAERGRFEAEQKMLKNQREKEREKWEQELKEGKEFIKEEINRRYYMPRNIAKAMARDP